MHYFFQKVTSLFEIFIYTMGSRIYAESICSKINELLSELEIKISSD